MRIVLYVHCFFPTHFFGTESYTLELAKGLSRLGHEPVVITARLQGEPPQTRLIENYTYDDVRVISIDKNIYPDRCVRDTYEQPMLRHVHERMLRKLQPDVIHICHLISHTTAVLDVTQSLGIPTFATLTDFFGFCYNNLLEDAKGKLCDGPDRVRANCIECFLKLEGARPNASPLAKLAKLPIVRPLASQGLARLGQNDTFVIDGFVPNDVVVRPDILHQAMGAYREAIAPTLFLKEAYERNGFPAPMRISHFGIDIDRGPKPPRSQAGLVRLGFIGQLAHHKGAHLLLDALRGCERTNLTLTIWGSHDQDPRYVARLRNQAQGLSVTFPGTIPRPELAVALGSIDYLVIPSTWYENSPLILLQALATHTPVIVSDVLGMTEFVNDGGNGFCFERGSVDSLTRVLQRVADDPQMAERLSANTSYDRVPADMARDVANLYLDHKLPWIDEPTARAQVAASPTEDPLEQGIEGPFEEWLQFNTVTAFERAENLARVAPFAATELMRETSGLERIEDFASHGAVFARAIAATTNRPLSSFRSWLDFGVGVGRLARMFKGFTGHYVGVDIDPRNISWLREHLPWVQAIRTMPGRPLPSAADRFDMIVSISVFSHLNEVEQTFYLAELNRVARPDAHIAITVHGERALERATDDGVVLELLGISPTDLDRARLALKSGSGFHFVRQLGHLTTDDYDYGITFIARRWIDAVWSEWYTVVDVIPGAIHDFQDLVVLRRR
jgi:glycosyltransferase involved in cell wall biosynthesis/SAM-dependent methyltransferase